MAKRIIGIDVLRLLFSFCVVLIHVPLLGSGALAPIYRCAVPFFYMASGYLVYTDSDLESRFLCTAKKWFVLWVKYFVILTVFSVCIHSYLKQPIDFDYQMLLEILSGQGSSRVLDVVWVKGYKCGIYVLWFLLSGCYAFLILSVLCRYLNHKLLYILFAVFYVACISLSAMGVIVPRLFVLSLPYIVLGIFIREYQEKIIFYVSMRNLILCFIASYIEWAIWRYYGVKLECYLLTPIFSILILIKMIGLRTSNQIVYIIANGGGYLFTLYLHLPSCGIYYSFSFLRRKDVAICSNYRFCNNTAVLCDN